MLAVFTDLNGFSQNLFANTPSVVGSVALVINLVKEVKHFCGPRAGFAFYVMAL
jgi:hypothetical protein